MLPLRHPMVKPYPPRASGTHIVGGAHQLKKKKFLTRVVKILSTDTCSRLYNSSAPQLYGTNLQYILGGCMSGNYETTRACLCIFMHYPPRAWRLHHHTAYKTRLYALHCAKVDFFPEPNRFRPVPPPGPCKVMHGRGPYEASRRTAPAESTSIHSSAVPVLAFFWRFFIVFAGAGAVHRVFP